MLNHWRPWLFRRRSWHPQWHLSVEVVGITDADAAALTYRGRLLLATDEAVLVDDGVSPEGAAALMTAITRGTWEVHVTRAHVVAWTKAEVKRWATDVVGLSDGDASTVGALNGRLLLTVTRDELVGDDPAVPVSDSAVPVLLTALQTERFGRKPRFLPQ